MSSLFQFFKIVFWIISFFSLQVQVHGEKDIGQLQEIPATQINSNSQGGSNQYPFVAYATGPQFQSAQTLEQYLGQHKLNLTLTQEDIKLGYSNEYHGIFFHLKSQDLINVEEVKKRKLLVFNHNIAGQVKIYRRVGLKGEWNYLGETGSHIPFHDRMVEGLQLAVPIEANPSESVFYFLSRFSNHRFDARARVIDEEEYIKSEQLRMYAYLFYMGALVSLVLYNFLIFLSLRDTLYLYYCFCALSLFFTGLTIVGATDFIFSPFNIVPSEHLLVFSCFSVISSVFFASRFYNIKEFSKSIFLLQRSIIVATFLLLFLYLGPWRNFFGGSHLGTVIDILIVSSIIVMMVGAVVSFRRGNTMAKFYITSWLFMFMGAFIYFGHYAGIFPRNIMTTHGVLWGNLLEMLIVSLGMAYKISILDQEKKEALLLARGKREYQKMVRVLLHDLGNPISLISYYTKLKFSRPDEFKVKSVKAWEKINFGLNKLTEIISFHREQEIHINKLTRTVELGPVLVREVFIEAQLMFEEKLEEKNIKLELSGNLDLFVLAERVSLINEVFNNLISNAIKYSPIGGRIIFHAQGSLDEVTVQVCDDGKGFHDNEISLFNNGEMIESTVGTIGEKGVGFGLSLVQAYMNVYQGRISLEHRFNNDNEPIKGACISLTFTRE